ncbi:MAG: flagellar basal body P-ring protein FlgI [Hyphomicrobiales bacterium]|nr:flagellar basal body P-ring protein FlgI [Hyphomicrobiales bacterium]
MFCLPTAAGVRVKDIAFVRGVRDNQLIGYGLVVGLQGTGDTLRNSVFTEQALQSMLDRMGIAVRNGVLRTRNVAAVLVTADVPPFVGVGSRIDVTVSSLGDATSLVGGTLAMTALAGPNGVSYASAQGQIAIAGFSAAGQTEQLSQGVPTTGRVAAGASIEREVPSAFDPLGPVTLELRNADFKTATRVSDAINAYARRRFGLAIAQERDNRTVEMRRPQNISYSRFMAEIGDLAVQPDTPARIVIDARSGTVVIGADVQISTVAVTHGALSVRISETPEVSQPAPLSRGKTVVTSRTSVDARESGGQFAIMRGASLKALVRGLNQIGLKPAGVIAILQAIKTAGALQAEIVVQ